jgi:general secretion pathway protein M
MQKSCTKAVGVFLALVLVLGAVIMLPWLRMNEQYDQAIEKATSEIRRYQALEARGPQLQAQLDSLDQEVSSASYYVDAETPALAAAALQARVKQAVDAVRGKLTSTQSLPLEDEGNAQRVAILVRMSGDVDVLLRVLHALEGEPPLLFVDNLTVRNKRRPTRRRRSRRQVTQNTGYSLDISFELAGYLREERG